jgi:hypothetical protein
MENPNLNKEEIEIKPTGSYLELDSEGYVINPASLEKIQEEWKPVVNELIETYKGHWGEKLKNVYIRGSVAKGEAVKGVSDIDSFCYVDLPKDSITTDWEEEAEGKVEEKFPFIEGAELMSRPLAIGPMNVILLNQSVCVYGDPIEVRKVKPGKDMMMHIPNLNKRIELLQGKLDTAESKESIKSACVWFAKDMLRTGFELTMERSQKYTRDLYLCYKTFAEYYPEKESQMREMLHYALNPTDDKEKIEKLRNDFSPWLIEEARKFQ